MPREPSKFQIQLIDTESYKIECAKCAQVINYMEDSEHVIIWPVAAQAWHFHNVCYEDVMMGMVEFYKVFIVEKRKTKISN